MPKQNKRMRELKAKVDRNHRYSTSEAIASVKDMANAKFDESVDVAIRLGVDPRHANQMVRGACSLPHGTGKSVTILVFAEGEAAKIAQESGADYVGSDDLIAKIKDENWFDFDKVISTRGMMLKLAKELGRILGPRKLMPNPKSGTVVEAEDMAENIAANKRGKIEYRVEKAGIVHAQIGRASMSAEALEANFLTLLAKLIQDKPAAAKGTYLKSISVSSTMGPGVKVDTAEAARKSEGV
jgi:large subunit ribosomal protein L1